jgi:YbbR domain-containing protein
MEAWMLDRLISSVVALCLACLVWMYVRSRDQETLDNVPVPVEISLVSAQSDNYELEVPGPSQITASFTGPPSSIRDLRGIMQSGEIRVETTITVPIDRMEESRFSDTVRIDAADIHAPAGVTPMVVEGRNRIPVIVRRLVERPLPVRFDSVSESRIAQAVVKPSTVLVRGPQEVLEHVREIPTQLYFLNSHLVAPPSPDFNTIRTVPLVTELEGHKVRPTPSSVTVQLTFQQQQKTYELTDVPIQFLCPANFSLKPVFRDERAGKISLRLQGPAADEAPGIVAYVDLSGKKWESGLYEEPLKLQLPKDFQLLQEPPRQVAFQLAPADPPAKPLAQ